MAISLLYTSEIMHVVILLGSSQVMLMPTTYFLVPSTATQHKERTIWLHLWSTIFVSIEYKVWFNFRLNDIPFTFSSLEQNNTLFRLSSSSLLGNLFCFSWHLLLCRSMQPLRYGSPLHSKLESMVIALI